MMNAYPQNGNRGMNANGANGWWGAVPQNNTQAPPPVMPQQAEAPQSDEPFQTIDGVMWIQGEGAAKAYNVPAGKTVMLLDSESDRFYVKQADIYGRPFPLQVFRYTKDEVSEPVSLSDFVTRKEFDELKAALTALTAPQDAETKEGE